jgi:hypothetical protein
MCTDPNNVEPINWMSVVKVYKSFHVLSDPKAQEGPIRAILGKLWIARQALLHGPSFSRVFHLPTPSDFPFRQYFSKGVNHRPSTCDKALDYYGIRHK